jgi:hypothetical protein
MSSATITQLSVLGKQDVETTISPQLTFWKSTFKRHTDFAMEPKAIEFQGQTGYGKTSQALLPRNGDLVAKLWLVLDIGQLDSGNGGARFVEDLGRAIFEEIKLEIGSVIYDRMFPELEHAWEELTTLTERQLGRLTGKSNSVAELTDWAKTDQLLYIPINFFFTTDYGSALPVVALHLTDVKISVKVKAKADVIVTTGAPYTITANDAIINDMYLMAETVYLGDAERDWFADTQQKYVITQNQFLGKTTVLAGKTRESIQLTFNHPCKELIVVSRKASNSTAKNYFNFSGEETGKFSGEAFKTMLVKLNGNDRFEKRDPLYFRVVQNKCHHSRIPKKHIYTYSFALWPEDPNPSGSLNMSRVDNTHVEFEYTQPLAESLDVFIFTRNINVSTIGSGVMLLRFAS